MPLLSIGRKPFLLDCKFLPCDPAPNEPPGHYDATRLKPCRLGATRGFSPRRYARRLRKKFAGKDFFRPHAKTDFHVEILCAADTLLRHGAYSFARNRMIALQVSPGTPASRSSCVGQRGAHPYTETSRIPQPIQRSPKKKRRKTAPGTELRQTACGLDSSRPAAPDPAPVD